jgi:tRNA A-37 threonylcarbamoyl transferase component Bud32
MLQEGAVIGGRYRLVSLIGEGGMASVWRAEDDTLMRAVAIKLLYVRTHRDSQSAIDQFLREARLAASVQHRNVIHTVDFGVTDDHMPFMVMELLQGESLADRMSRSPALRIEEVVHIANLTLRGLAAVHEAGIVHRDLKPQNIFLERDADGLFPKILDFGISRSLGGSESAIATQQGLIVGTPEYMAPEQARGASDIDKRADIYAMGAILYEGITGRVPFEAESLASLLVKIATTEPLPIRELRPDVPELLSDCIAQAMAHDREQRFADAGTFRKALTRAVERSFGTTHQGITSEGPIEQMPLEVPVAAPANRQEPQLAAAAGWGGFAELESRQRVAPAPRASAPRVSAAQAPAARGFAAQVMRTSQAQPEPIQTTHDEALFGDNPLDTFAGEADRLELDVSGPVVSGPTFQRVAGVAMPANQTSRRESVATAAPVARGRAVSTPSAAFWLLPAVLVLGLLALLFVPSLFSLPLPDDAAARKREAENPATRDGKPFREIGPRPRLGPIAPAQRDVTF